MATNFSNNVIVGVGDIETFKTPYLDADGKFQYPFRQSFNYNIQLFAHEYPKSPMDKFYSNREILLWKQMLLTGIWSQMIAPHNDYDLPPGMVIISSGESYSMPLTAVPV